MKKIFLLVLLFVISSTVYAATYETKEAMVRKDFSIQLNNEDIALKNDIIVIDGVSYIPLRDVSELLGIDVSFEKGVISLVTEQERDLKITILQNKILGIDEGIAEIKKYISLVESNIERRKSLDLDTIEAEQEVSKKRNEILTLEENKNTLLSELEGLINGN